MQIHELVQGSPEWHAHRATHWNASDAPAMLGCSPYETRTQLIHRLSTGIAPEVDAATQRRFDEGHRIEALARPLAEEIIGEELYPVTGSEGELSASFDGLTMGEDISGEHKSLNDGIRASLPHTGRDSHTRNDGAMLGKMYRVQIEQQLMVSGAERALFSATRWEGDELVEERHCWYEPDMALRAEIIAGWKQLAIDRDAYVPAPMTVEAVGKAPETLPALHIEVTGMVTASNLAEFKETALAAIHGVNRELTTDAQFADAEQAVKWCSDVETRLAAAKEHALSQTASIDALFKTIDDISAEARRVRLDLDKLVKARKEQIKAEIVQAGRAAYEAHEAGLMKEGPWICLAQPDFGAAIKSLRTLDSIRNAVETTLASAKIKADESARKIRESVRILADDGAGFDFLFNDRLQLIGKSPDDLRLLVKSRIADHKAAEEKKEAETRERIRAEEQAKAEKAAREQVEREQREAAATELAAAKQAPAGAELSPAAQALNEAEGAQRFAATHRKLDVPANVVPMRHAQPAAPATPPTLTLGAIGTRLGFNLSADFLKNLGFTATKVKASCLYQEADFPLICARLVAHIQIVQTKQAA
ncbi:MAG: hypothetical protein B7Z68_07325 [Acidobacteria bacterium 21-70-11]|nr:MAG: hypothetical protein B7Z68_07325 [Acidobacteria bacterium 21-70-11]